MDKEQEELQFLGFFGIFKESIKIILAWPKIFSKISLAFILPLSCLSIANVELITKFLQSKIIDSTSTLHSTQVGSPTYNKNFDIISKEWITLWLIQALIFISSLIFSLFSISAVVYTIACIFTSKEITFTKILSVVPKVWKRLMITFLCYLFVVFTSMLIYAIVVIVISTLILFTLSSKQGHQQIGLAIWVMITSILFLVGVIYMSVIWQLSNVVSVLEKYRGFKAMQKSRELIKGKMKTAIAIMLVLSLCYVPLQILIQQIIGSSSAKIGLGILCVIYNTVLALYALVVQTVFYFVCKSYHHENIDKSSLADHLEAFHGDYIPLKETEIKQFHV